MMMMIDDRYFDYLFYIDFEASMAETSAQHALGHLQVPILAKLRVFFFSPSPNRFLKILAFRFCRNSQVSFVSLVVIQWI